MYYLVQYGILTLICSYLVLKYAAPSVSYHVKFWSILTWVLNFAVALLVPEDVYLTLLQQKQGIGQQAEAKWVAYQYLILYWSVYLLTWTIIPVLQQWQNSGDLQSRDRLRRSLKTNGVFYLYMLIGGVAILLLMIYLNVGEQMGLMTFLKCLATIWGIFLQMVMMGYAIVQIPRSFWIRGVPTSNLQYCYKKIAEIEQARNQALFQFKQVACFVLYSKSTVGNDDIRLYSDETIKLVPQHLQKQIPGDYQYFLSPLDYLKNNPIDLQNMIEHHRLMKRVLMRHRRLTLQIDQYFQSAILQQDIISSLQTGKFDSIIKGNQQYKYYWYCIIRPQMYKTIAVFLTLAGMIILISQTQVFLTKQSSLLGWVLLFENLKVLRAMVFISIAFISYMVYYSLFSLKLSNVYGLYKNNSDGPSLMFATINFSRVGVAIVLNFFDMIKMDGIYTKVMGTVEMGLIGQWIIKGLPGVLWLIVLCHYLNLWGKFIDKFKLSSQLKFSTHEIPLENPSWIEEDVKRYRTQLQLKQQYHQI